MTKTASAIGISRKKLWERLRRLGLTVPARASCPKFERQWR
jgi:DNA-binding NtrC family response regulator